MFRLFHFLIWPGTLWLAGSEDRKKLDLYYTVGGWVQDRTLLVLTT